MWDKLNNLYCRELKKLTAIPDEHKDAVLKAYYDYVKVEHKLKCREFDNE